MSTQSKPTKRELREQRRAERLESERAEAAAAARKRRGLTLLGALGVAAVAVVIAIAVSSSGGKSDTPAPAASTGQAASLFAGIPERDGVLGKKSAPLTLTEFVDLQCPICKQAAAQTMPTVFADYVRSGKVKVQVHVLSFLGQDSGDTADESVGVSQGQGS